ncbi:hypothetical protein QZH56_02845 [Streptomyces olivoreticuli]|uniref:hypothetical protein n=1 Tax=Streptomyces olivoreticuli TaxID=68246 RepID=UPI00265A038D|nr:hypothetical protein [Streptomyces olivoreticuli]WKK24602.1 hypothetical protein QZH56_02845 [Streptomyces olivoreticuli]
MPINPNWPVVAEDRAPYWNCAGGDSPLDRYVEVTPRYLANTDGTLDPLDSSGPWAGHIMAYQPYRKRAQWPPTANLLTQVQATGGDLGGYSTGPLDTSGSGQDIFSLTTAAWTLLPITATAPAGMGVMGQQRRDSPVAVSNTINVAVETICGRPTEEPLARSMAEADSEKRTFPKIGSVPCLSSGSSSSSSGF